MTNPTTRTLCLVLIWFTLLCKPGHADLSTRSDNRERPLTVKLQTQVSYISDLQCQKELVCLVGGEKGALQRLLEISIVEKSRGTVLKRVSSIYYLWDPESDQGDVETSSGLRRVNGSLMVRKALPPNKGFGGEDFVCKVVYANREARIMSMESQKTEELDENVCKVPDLIAKLDIMEKRLNNLWVVDAHRNVCTIPNLVDAMATLDRKFSNLKHVDTGVNRSVVDSGLEVIDKKLSNIDKKLNSVEREQSNLSDLNDRFDLFETRLNYLSNVYTEVADAVEKTVSSQQDISNKLDLLGMKLGDISEVKRKFDILESKLNHVPDVFNHSDTTDVQKKFDIQEPKLDQLSVVTSNVTESPSKQVELESQSEAPVVNETGPKECAENSTCDSFRDLSEGSTISPRQIITWSDCTTILCDTETDGGGWTVFQKRFNGLLNFSRSWEEYENGFGDIEGGEFWLGLKLLHHLTETHDCELRIDIKAARNSEYYFAHYSRFSVSGPEINYKLKIGGFSGTVVHDSMKFVNGREFSTWDRDHDTWLRGSCAQKWRGGWWHGHCSHTFLNGGWKKDDRSLRREEGVWWWAVDKGMHYVTSTEMKLRPKRS